MNVIIPSSHTRNSKFSWQPFTLSARSGSTAYQTSDVYVGDAKLVYFYLLVTANTGAALYPTIYTYHDGGWIGSQSATGIASLATGTFEAMFGDIAYRAAANIEYNSRVLSPVIRLGVSASTTSSCTWLAYAAIM